MTIVIKRLIKENIRLIAYLSFFLVFTILLPILFLFNSINIERKLFQEMGFLTIISIISGCFATILTLIKSFFLYHFSRISLIISIGIQVQLFVYILFWAQFWTFEIELEYFYLLMDLSNVSSFLNIIPPLFITRIIYSYIIGYKRAKIQAIILYALKNGAFSSTNQIRRYFSQSEFKLKFKKVSILKIIEILESEKKRYIIKKKKYQLTKKGKEFLGWFEKNRSISLKKIVLTPKKISSKIEVPLQVWTEEDLKEYNKNR